MVSQFLPGTATTTSGIMSEEELERQRLRALMEGATEAQTLTYKEASLLYPELFSDLGDSLENPDTFEYKIDPNDSSVSLVAPEGLQLADTGVPQTHDEELYLRLAQSTDPQDFSIGELKALGIDLSEEIPDWNDWTGGTLQVSEDTGKYSLVGLINPSGQKKTIEEVNYDLSGAGQRQVVNDAWGAIQAIEGEATTPGIPGTEGLPKYMTNTKEVRDILLDTGLFTEEELTNIDEIEAAYNQLEILHNIPPVPVLDDSISTIFKGTKLADMLPQEAMQEIATMMQNDPEGTIDKIVGDGWTPEGEFIFRAMGYDTETIDNIYGFQESMKQMIPIFTQGYNTLDAEGFIKDAIANPEKFLELNRRISWSPERETAVRAIMPYLSDNKVFEVFHGKYDKGWFGKLADTIDAGIADLMGGITGGLQFSAQKLNWQGAEDFLNMESDWWEDQARVQLPPDVGLGWTFIRSLPTTLYMMDVSFAAGGFIPTVGKLGTFGNQLLKFAGMGASSRPLESTLEAGGTYRQALQQGYSKDEAANMATEVFMKNMQLTGLDAAQFVVGLLPFAKIGNQITKGLMQKGLVKYTLKGAGIASVALSEGGEEYYQQIIQMQAMGEDVSAWSIRENLSNEEIWQVTMLGMMSGGLFGGGAEVISHLVTDTTIDNLPPEIATKVRADIAEQVRNGVDIQLAKKIALDKVANNPEVEPVIKGSLTVANAKFYENLIETDDPARAEQIQTKLRNDVKETGMQNVKQSNIQATPKSFASIEEKTGIAPSEQPISWLTIPKNITDVAEGIRSIAPNISEENAVAIASIYNGLAAQEGITTDEYIQKWISSLEKGDIENTWIAENIKQRLASGEVELRADIVFDAIGKATIRSFQEYTDEADIVHEVGHFLLEHIIRIGGNDNQVIQQYAKENGKETTEDIHEFIADSFVTYWMSGKAPTSALESVFSRIKQTLLQIYSGLRQSNVIAIPQEVREVFDRAIAGIPSEGVQETVATQTRAEGSFAKLEETGEPIEPRDQQIEKINKNFKEPVKPMQPIKSTDITKTPTGTTSMTVARAKEILAPVVKYILRPDAYNAFEHQRTMLRRETKAKRAQNAQTRLEELAAQGVPIGEAWQIAKKELEGKMPVLTQGYPFEITEDIIEAGKVIIRNNHNIKDDFYEITSTIDAWINAINGNPIPTHRGRPTEGTTTYELFGEEGGSAWDRLTLVFGREYPELLDAIENTSSRQKPLHEVVTESVHEVMEWDVENKRWSIKADMPQEPLNIFDPEFTKYLQSLPVYGTQETLGLEIPNEIQMKFIYDPTGNLGLQEQGQQFQLFEKGYYPPSNLEDLRSDAEKQYSKNMLELRIQLAEKKITKDYFDIAVKTEEQKLQVITRFTQEELDYIRSLPQYGMQGTLGLEIPGEGSGVFIYNPTGELGLQVQAQQFQLFDTGEYIAPSLIDERPLNERLYAQDMLDLRIQRAEGKINDDQYKLNALEIRDKHFPPPPTPKFPKYFSDEIDNQLQKKKGQMISPKEKDIIYRLLHGMGLNVLDIGNLLRANKASFDFSFWRQVSPLIARNPAIFYRANIEAVKAYYSQNSADANAVRIYSDPRYELYEQYRKIGGGDPLRMPEMIMKKKGAERSRGTEEFGFPGGDRPLQRLQSKLPWVHISQRSYETGINTMVWYIWNQHYDMLLRLRDDIASGRTKLPEGEAFDISSEMSKFQMALADMVQRGNLKVFDSIDFTSSAPVLSAVTFAARATIGRLMTPRHLFSSNPRVRSFAWQNLGSWVAVVTGILAMGAWANWWDVEWDPRSGDFGVIRIGNMRIDPWAGYKQFATLFTRISASVYNAYGGDIAVGISGKTGAPYDTDIYDLMQTFLGGKASPIAQIALDALTKKTFFGEDVEWDNFGQWVDRLAPFMVSDIYNAMQEGWKYAAIGILPGWVGMGVNTYTGDWGEAWDRKGTLKYPDNARYGTTPVYWDMADIWADYVSQFKNVDPSTLSEDRGYPEWLQFMVETDRVQDTVDLIPHSSLIDLGEDFDTYYQMWNDSQKVDDVKQWIKDNNIPADYYKGNMTAQEYGLLLQYYNLDSDEKKEAFLEKHPELTADRKDTYLINNPEINAQLAFWGQGKILTSEAFNLYQGLIDKYGIPDTAIVAGMCPPKEVAPSYFDYLDQVSQFSPSSLETKLWKIKLQQDNPDSYDWLSAKGNISGDGWKPIDTGNMDIDTYIKRAELIIKNRTVQAEYDALETKEEKDAFWLAKDADGNLIHEQFRQDLITIEMYEKMVPTDYTPGETTTDLTTGGDTKTTLPTEYKYHGETTNLQTLFVDYKNMLAENGFSSSKLQLFLLTDGAALFEWGRIPGNMNDDGWAPIDTGKMSTETYIKYLKINVDYADLDAEWNRIHVTAATTDEEDRLHEALLIENPSYAEARIYRGAYSKGIPDEWIETFVEYVQYGHYKGSNLGNKWLWQHQDFYKAVREIMEWGPLDMPRGGQYGYSTSAFGLPGGARIVGPGYR